VDQMTLAIVGGMVLACIGGSAMFALAADPKADRPAETRLAVLWSSGDPHVARQVCFMYTHNAKRAKWFDHVVLIVWGHSTRLLAGDEALQAEVKAMIGSGVKVQACIACARNYGVVEDLRKLGIEVKGMGKPLTDYLQGGWKVLCF